MKLGVTWRRQGTEGSLPALFHPIAVPRGREEGLRMPTVADIRKSRDFLFHFQCLHRSTSNTCRDDSRACALRAECKLIARKNRTLPPISSDCTWNTIRPMPWRYSSFSGPEASLDMNWDLPRSVVASIVSLSPWPHISSGMRSRAVIVDILQGTRAV